jgi:hypothetical protein
MPIVNDSPQKPRALTRFILFGGAAQELELWSH